MINSKKFILIEDDEVIVYLTKKIIKENGNVELLHVFDNGKKAIDFFNQALQVDPNYALAHEGLASTYTVMEFNAIVPPGTVVALAELHAAKALELDDSLAGAYIALGAVKTMQNYDLQTRENYYKQALLKNPNHRTARLWLSNIYTVQGKFEEACVRTLHGGPALFLKPKNSF